MKTLILCLGISLAGCAPTSNTTTSAPTVCPQPQYNKTLVVFGDSQAQGIASPLNGCYFSYAYAAGAADNYFVNNQAKGGSTLLAAGVYGPSQQDMINSYSFTGKESVLWVAGFNEVLYDQTNQENLSQFEAAFPVALAYLSTHAAHVFIGTPWQQPSYLPDFGSDSAVSMYAQAVRSAVTQTNLSNVTLIDINQLFFPTQADIQNDKIHLTVSGQYDLASVILNYLF